MLVFLFCIAPSLEGARTRCGNFYQVQIRRRIPNTALQPGDDPDNHLLLPFIKHIGEDQKQFWTYPSHLNVKDLKWIVPFTGVTAGLIASDSWILKQIPNKPNQLSRSKNISDYSVYSLIGIGGGSYLFGQMTHNDHLSETGLLSGEAAINSTALTYLIKEITQRQRPNVETGDGKFFQGGQSFPFGAFLHSMVDCQRLGARISQHPESDSRLWLSVNGHNNPRHCAATFFFRRIYWQRLGLVFRAAGVPRSS